MYTCSALLCRVIRLNWPWVGWRGPCNMWDGGDGGGGTGGVGCSYKVELITYPGELSTPSITLTSMTLRPTL